MQTETYLIDTELYIVWPQHHVFKKKNKKTDVMFQDRINKIITIK